MIMYRIRRAISVLSDQQQFNKGKCNGVLKPCYFSWGGNVSIGPFSAALLIFAARGHVITSQSKNNPPPIGRTLPLQIRHPWIARTGLFLLTTLGFYKDITSLWSIDLTQQPWNTLEVAAKPPNPNSDWSITGSNLKRSVYLCLDTFEHPARSADPNTTDEPGDKFRSFSSRTQTNAARGLSEQS